MENLKKCVAETLDSYNAELYPHLPYILQDLWAIGADPENMQKLTTEHICAGNKIKKRTPFAIEK